MKLFRFFHKYWNHGLFDFKLLSIRWRNIKAYIEEGVKVDCQPMATLGKGSSIRRFSTIIVKDQSHSNNNLSSLEIGSNTYIGEYNNIRAAGGKIVIGDNCLISQHVSIVASNHQIKKDKLICEQGWDENRRDVTIEDDVWVGTNTVILPGIIVHKGAVVAAGAIVTKDVPEYAIVAGNPAKIIKYRQ